MSDEAEDIMADVKSSLNIKTSLPSILTDFKEGQIPSSGDVEDYIYGFNSLIDAFEFLLSTSNDTQLTVVHNIVSRKVLPSRANRCKTCATSHPDCETENFWQLDDETRKRLNNNPPDRDIGPKILYRMQCRCCRKKTEWHTTEEDALDAWNNWKLRRQDYGPL